MTKTLSGFCLAVSIAVAGLAQTTPSPTAAMATPTRTPTSMTSMATPTRTVTPAMGTPTRTATAGMTVTATPVGTPTAGGTPTSVDQCRNDGWRNFTNPRFKNQGDCVSYVASQGRAGGNPRTPTPVP
jgi:hypothetical protein